MSHVSNINRNELVDLEDIKAACENNPLFRFREESRSFQSYNGSNASNFEIEVEGASYSIGVQRERTGIQREREGYRLQWDTFYRGGLPQKIGQEGGILTREIDMAKVRRLAMQKRMRVCDVETDRMGWKIIRVEV